MRVGVSSLGIRSLGGRKAVQDLSSGLAGLGIEVHELTAAPADRGVLESLQRVAAVDVLTGSRSRRLTALTRATQPPVDVAVSCDGMSLSGDCPTVVFVQQVLPYSEDGRRAHASRERLRLRVQRSVMTRTISRAAGMVVQLPHVATTLDASPKKGTANIACLRHRFRQVPLRTRRSGPATGFLSVGHLGAYKRPTFLGELADGVFREYGETIFVAGPDVAHGSGLHHLGELNQDALRDWYSRVRGLIVTSLCESFCYPIYEALQHGVPVIAPALDYTRHLEGMPGVYLYPASSRDAAVAALGGASRLPHGWELETDYSPAAELLLKVSNR